MQRQRNEIHGFTIDELERLETVIERSWDAIAGDMFFNERGERDESITFKQDEVAEIALDADRWRDRCDPNEIESTHELIKKYFRLDEQEQNEVLENTLRYKIYGY